MGPGDILAACIIFSPFLALAIILWALYLLTEGVEGIGRRFYAMLLLLLSAVGVGIVVFLPMLLGVVFLGWGLLAVGIPVLIVIPILKAAARTADNAVALPKTGSNSYLEWIKRVAQGEKAQGRTAGNEEGIFVELCPRCKTIDPALSIRGFCRHCQPDVDEAGAAQQAVLPEETPAPSLQFGAGGTHSGLWSIDMGIESVKALAARLEELRPSATVAACWRAATDPHKALDALVESLGFRAIGKNWRRIDKEQATVLLRRVLERDLAYGAPEMEAEQAEALADAYLGIPGGAEYFTNGAFSESGWVGHKVAPGTFETGVAWVGGECVGILWVQDED
jgi:hypothetical protein